MEIARASLVEATAGREQGKRYFVMDLEGEYLFLADGKTRKIEAPKKKKRKHVRLVQAENSRVAEKIRSNEKITNSELRKAIAILSGGNPNQEG